MSQFDEIFNDVRANSDYEENARLLTYLGNILKNIKKPLPLEESSDIRNFAVSEMKRLMDAIPTTKNYREKDKMFYYEDSLLMIYTLAGKDMSNVNEEQMETISNLVAIVSKERALENAIDDIFKLDKIEKSDIDKAIDIVKPLKDEYQRSMFYQGLNENKEQIKKLTIEAKSALADFVADDLARIMKNASDIDDDKTASLEFAMDVCKYFINDRLLTLLQTVMSIEINRIRYYAFETLLENNVEVSTDVVKKLAEDLEYAELTYGLLVKHGKSNLFPAEYSSPEYLAKSNLVRWLTYPTELNKKPDEIALLGAITIKKELFHIFKYKSDSDNLSDDLKNVYLIGWSGNCGSTFSNFDKLSDYEKKTLQKTVKYIAKKLIK